MMEIIKISPQGFCKGVIHAIAIINKALQNPDIKRPIYMYGGLVHNKHIINAYREKGVIIVDKIDDIYSGTVIITAHGVSDKVLKLINERHLGLINATCFDVLKTHRIIKNKLNEGYTVIFYGKASHPETKGVLGISDEIKLVEKGEDIEQLQIDNPKIAFTTQTTMSYLDVEKMIESLKRRFPNMETFEDVCLATKLRQNALLEQVREADLCIIVGDPTSNNTNKLKEVCEKHTNVPCIMIESITDLTKYDLTKYKKVAITSGASTPTAIVNEIIKGLKEQNYQTTLTNDDYLSY